MTRNNIILFLALTFCISCKAQDIQIVLKDKNGDVSDDDITVFNLLKNDTITLKSFRPSYYRIENDNQKKSTLIILYYSKLFKIEDVSNDIKSIFIEYDSNAQDGCYVINKIYSDAIQSSNLNDLKDCKAITNIYLYNHYNPNRNSSSNVKLRKKN